MYEIVAVSLGAGIFVLVGPIVSVGSSVHVGGNTNNVFVLTAEVSGGSLVCVGVNVGVKMLTRSQPENIHPKKTPIIKKLLSFIFPSKFICINWS